MPSDTERRPCEVCGKQIAFAWTDHHGIAQCVHCGSPFRLFHYEPNEAGENCRVEKPPELLVSGEELRRMIAFHRETGAKVSAVGMGLSFPGGYDVATSEDIKAGNKWFRANPAIDAAMAAERGEG